MNERETLDAILAALGRIEAGQREVMAELRRRRAGPRKRAATVARKAKERALASGVTVSAEDMALAESYLRRGRRRRSPGSLK